MPLPYRFDGNPQFFDFVNPRGKLIQCYQWKASPGVEAVGVIGAFHGIESHTRLSWLLKHPSVEYYEENCRLLNPDPEDDPWEHGEVTYAGSWVQKFNDAGFHFISMDFESHGLSECWKKGRGCCFKSFEDLSADAFIFARKIRLRYPRLAFFMVGTSMGGCVLARMLEMSLDMVEALGVRAISTPAACAEMVSGEGARLSSEGGRLTREVSLIDPKRSERRISRDPEIVEPEPVDDVEPEPVDDDNQEDSESEVSVNNAASSDEDSEGAVPVESPFQWNVNSRPILEVEGAIFVGGMFDIDEHKSTPAYRYLGGLLRLVSHVAPSTVVVPRGDNTVYPWVNLYIKRDPLVYKGGMRARTIQQVLQAAENVRDDCHRIRNGTSEEIPIASPLPPSTITPREEATVATGNTTTVAEPTAVGVKGVFFLHNKFDTVCSVRGAWTMYNGIPLDKKDKELLVINGMQRHTEEPTPLDVELRNYTDRDLGYDVDVWHNLASDPDQHRVFPRILSWMLSRAKTHYDKENTPSCRN